MTRYFVIKVNPSFAVEKGGEKYETLHRCQDIRKASNYYEWYIKEHPTEHIIFRKCEFGSEMFVMEDIKEHNGETK